MAFSAGAAHSQVQERKLIDRLLEPNMSLQNSAQTKQFTPATDSTTTKKVRTKTFYVAERPREKNWLGARSFFTRMFTGTRAARDGQLKANVTPRNHFTTKQLAPSTSAYAASRPAQAANQTYAVSQFSGTRPFLVRGKSQRALSQQDHPLTIEQVRELLNKNK
ncbi:MAG: hypothetical protein ABI992_05390 [Chthoniobacterales bacterium]